MNSTMEGLALHSVTSRQEYDQENEAPRKGSVLILEANSV